MLLDCEDVLIADVGRHQLKIHLIAPGIGVPASAVRSVGHISLLELVDHSFVQFHHILALRFLRFYFIGQSHKSVEGFGLVLAHPVAAVDQRGFYHFELLAGQLG